MKVTGFYELKIDSRGKTFTSLTALTLTHKSITEFCIIGGSSIGELMRVPLIEIPGFEYKSIVKAHSGEVLQICSSNETLQLCTLGADNFIRIWKIKFDPSTQAMKKSTDEISISVDLERAFTVAPQIPTFIRCIFTQDQISIIVVTNLHANVMFVIPMQENSQIKQLLHRIDEDHTKQVHDLTYNSQLNISATISKDNLIKIWDMSTNILIREIGISEVASSIGFANPRGDLLIGAQNDIFLLRMEDYLPNRILRGCLDFDFEDDVMDAGLSFNSELDFWKIFKSDEQKMSEALEKYDAEESI